MATAEPASHGAHKKATAMLDDAARARLYGQSFVLDAGPSSSAPPGSADADDDLMDLVEEEFYNGYEQQGADAVTDFAPPRRSEGKAKLLVILADAAADAAASRIGAEAERAVRDAAPADAGGVRKRLVERLRASGFNAGLCRSSWEKSSSIPAPGAHEYVDVTMGTSPSSSRYIVEVNIASEFDIARASAEYRDLLRSLPPVLVARPDAFEQLSAAMCAAAADSVRGAGMHLAPWRRKRYVQAKWSVKYERVAVTPVAAAGTRHEGVTPVDTARLAVPAVAMPVDTARRTVAAVAMPVDTARRAVPTAPTPEAQPSKQEAGGRALVRAWRPGGGKNCGMEMGRAIGREAMMDVRPMFRGM